VSVVIVLVAVVILGGVVVVAMGRGGELARDRVELPHPTDLRTWTDVAAYRPPAALLGYHAAATERALSIIARTIAERDAEIHWLRRRLSELDPDSASAGGEPPAGLAPGGGYEDLGSARQPAAAAPEPAAPAAGLDWDAPQAGPPVEAGFTAQPAPGGLAGPDE
jgi:hypothetical protein